MNSLEPLPYLPPNTIIPNPAEDDREFIRYLNRLYEEIALVVNSKEPGQFIMTIGSSAAPIPYMPMWGAFFLTVYGTEYGMPCGTWSLAQSTSTGSGTSSELSYQSGTAGIWSTITLSVTSVENEQGFYQFNISHDASSDQLGEFYVRFLPLEV